MSTPIVTTTDFALYLGSPASFDVARAQLILGLAQDLCESVVSPLMSADAGTILSVATRAFNNVSSTSQVGLGSAFASFSPTGQGGVGGLYLSKSDIANLRRRAGRGGAFTIDPTPATAGSGLQPWDQNVTWLDGVPIAEDFRQ